VVNRTTLLASAGESNLREADQLEGDDYWVCLFINAKVLSRRTQGNSTLVPDHWVVLRSRIRFSPSLQMKVFTWGEGEYSIPEDPHARLTAAEFLGHYRGFVAAKH
jgi:hypothetical protein